LAFEAGELDLIEVVDPFAARDLDESVRRSSGILPITLLTLNQSREDLSDPTVRAAISQAINRDDIASLFEGTAEPATGVLPVNVDGWAQGSTSYEFDADSAKAILEPLGLELELLYDSSSGAVSAAAEVLAAQLGEVGVTVSLNGSDNGTVVGRAFASDFDMVILQLAAISPTILDPIGALAALYYPWAKADTTLIFEQFLGGSGSFDVSAWEAASAAIQDDARSQNALIGLYNFSPIDVVSSRVVGFERTPFAVWYSNGLGVSE
jgi:ABC-type transport system substrate-binding protein